MQNPLVALCNDNINHFDALRGKCQFLRNQKDGKYLVSDRKYNRGMYTFLKKIENEYLSVFHGIISF